MKPTDEQTAAADAFHTGHHLALQAGAGTGKTTTLALLAHATKRRGRYLAYNRAIAQDATTRFPSSVQCKTAHALAYAAVGHRYTNRLNAPRRPAWQTGQALGLTKAVRIGDREISQRALSNAVLRTVTCFCHTADEKITRHHVPKLRGLEDKIKGQRPDVSAAVGRTAYRIVQESLTNIARHAAAATASVRIDYRPDALAIRIDDDGKATPDTAPTLGLGLLGMRERVTALGGRLRAEPRSERGFTVQVELPVEQTS